MIEQETYLTHAAVGAPRAGSAVVAMLLEVVLPGLGAFYLGRLRQGVIWLVSGLIALIVAAGILIVDARSFALICVNAGLSAQACGAYLFSDAKLVVITLVALLWLNARLAIITNQQTAAPANGATWRVVSLARFALIGVALGVCTLGLWTWYGMLDTLTEALMTGGSTFGISARFLLVFANQALPVASVAVGCYLFALRRLARARWWVALGEALGAALLIATILAGLSEYALIAVGVPVGAAMMLNDWVNTLAYFLIAAALGVSFACCAATWRVVRDQIAARVGAGWVYTLNVFIITTLLTIMPTILHHYIQGGYQILNDAGRDYVWQFLGSALLLALVVVASFQVSRWLNRATAQS